MSKNEHVSNLLEDLQAGVFVQKVGRAISEVALGVVSTGKKGKVTIELEFKQIGDSNQVACSHTLKYARPTQKGKYVEDDTTATPLYVNGKGVVTLFPETPTGTLPGFEPEGRRTEENR